MLQGILQLLDLMYLNEHCAPEIVYRTGNVFQSFEKHTAGSSEIVPINRYHISLEVNRPR